jgi:hypothetical protein
MKTLISAGLLAVLAAATPAWADHDRYDSGINERQERLSQRIERGWRAGELTQREYRRLVAAARDIERAERVYRSDGRLSPRERSDLHARLDHLARAIRYERHDVEQHPGSYNYAHPAYRHF